MTSHPFNILRQDLRWSLRTIRKRPAIAMVIVLSMGLAIGATTAAFSVVNAFMLRSWNSDGMDRVVRLREDYARPGQPPDIRGFTLANLGTWRRENTVFEAIAAGTGQSATLVDGESAERVAAGIVTANFFSVLGFRPILGRTFTAEEDAPDRRDAVVLGYGLWQSRFAGDTAVIGRSITLNGRPRTVVGVMPRGIKHPYQSDLWVPLGYREDAPSGVSVYAPARLRRDVTLERANAELDAMAQRIHDANPAPNVPTGAQVTLLQPEMLGRLDRVLYLLAAAAVLVLLIATANVSNLLLAQGLEQHAEVSVRTALGATRGRLARQFLVYSVLLSVLGGIVGVALSLGTLGPLVSLSPLYGAGEFDIQPRLDLPVLVFTLLTTIVVGVVFGIVPALRTSGANPMAVLRESSRVQTLTRGSRRWLRGFVVVQVALAFVLLIASGAMARGLTALTREPWGFDRRNVLAFEMTVPAYRYQDPSQRLGVIERVIARIGELPGVEAIGATSVAPLWAGTAATGFNIETGPAPNAQEIYLAHRRTVTPGYFGAMQMPLVAGRAFDDRDTEGGVPVAVVSQSLAERYWPGQNPIGKRVKEGPFAGPGAWREVVGVVGSLRENAGTDIPSGDALYFPLRQDVGAVFGEMTVMVRATSEPLLLLASVRSTIAGIDRELPIANASTLENRFASFTATERLSTRLTSGLGGIGLFLSAIGIYGLLSFTLGRRLPEFGIRAALGARPADVRRLIARDALGLLGGGLVIGAVLAYALRPLLDTSMFPGAETGPIVIAGAVIGLIIVTMVSSLIPSLKAGRVNPVRAMH